MHGTTNNPALRLVEAEVVDPGALQPAQADAFLDRLFRLHQSIFANVSMDEFVFYTVRPDALRTRIQLYRNEAGDMVGYCAIHLFEVPIENGIAGILRSEAGLLPSYRGSGTTLWFGAKEALRYKALHPLRTVALFTSLVHPSSYHMLCKYVWRCYPYPGRRFPPRWKKLLITLIDWAGYEPVDPGDPLIRKDGWSTRESQADVEAWKQNPHEDVRYYVSRNPDYAQGNGLTWIAPISLANLLMTTILYSCHIVHSWVQKFRVRPLGR